MDKIRNIYIVILQHNNKNWDFMATYPAYLVAREKGSGVYTRKTTVIVCWRND